MGSARRGGCGSRCSSGSRRATRCSPSTCRASATPRRSRPASLRASPALADALERALDDVGWDAPHVAGNSMGGWLGARARPPRPRRDASSRSRPPGMWSPRENAYSRGSAPLPARRRPSRLAPLRRRAHAAAPSGRTLLFSGVSSRPWRIRAGRRRRGAAAVRRRPRLGGHARGDDRRPPARPRLDRVPGADRLGLRATRCSSRARPTASCARSRTRSSSGCPASGTCRWATTRTRSRARSSSSPRATRARATAEAEATA